MLGNYEPTVPFSGFGSLFIVAGGCQGFRGRRIAQISMWGTIPLTVHGLNSAVDRKTEAESGETYHNVDKEQADGEVFPYLLPWDPVSQCAERLESRESCHLGRWS